MNKIQSHEGDGDNVGRDKVLNNISNYLRPNKSTKSTLANVLRKTGYRFTIILAFINIAVFLEKRYAISSKLPYVEKVNINNNDSYLIWVYGLEAFICSTFVFIITIFIVIIVLAIIRAFLKFEKIWDKFQSKRTRLRRKSRKGSGKKRRVPKKKSSVSSRWKYLHEKISALTSEYNEDDIKLTDKIKIALFCIGLIAIKIVEEITIFLWSILKKTVKLVGRVIGFISMSSLKAILILGVGWLSYDTYLRVLRKDNTPLEYVLGTIILLSIFYYFLNFFFNQEEEEDETVPNTS